MGDGTFLNHAALTKLLKEDIDWLLANAPHSCERDHILQVLRQRIAEPSEFTRLREQVEWKPIPDSTAFVLEGSYELYGRTDSGTLMVVMSEMVGRFFLEHGWTHYRPFTAPEVENDD